MARCPQQSAIIRELCNLGLGAGKEGREGPKEERKGEREREGGVEGGREGKFRKVPERGCGEEGEHSRAHGSAFIGIDGGA